MLTQAHTVCFRGIQALPVMVQTQISHSALPSFSIVGLADKAVNESRERIRSALYTLGIALPPKRILMNLAPANIQKEGSHYDLPMAIGLLMALEILPPELKDYIALGELGLDAALKPVHGVLSAALFAAQERKHLICPAETGGEAVWGGDLQVLAPQHLLELVNHFKGIQVLSPPEGRFETLPSLGGDFSEIKGQEAAKRALTIAAAGKHNVLMSGPPGSGKSMLAARMISLLPPLSPQEALEVTMIHSMSQKYGGGHLMRQRPFRAPHHSVSVPALVGGGLRGVPGEISLAHAGVLFLDELPEFSRPALESLRQSLETGEAVVARANYHVTYPARCQLIAAMNPCRCGYLGNLDKQCAKAPACGALYQKNLSGPLLDRIDLFVEAPAVKMTDLETLPPPASSATLTRHVHQARAIQQERYKAQPFFLNADAPPALLDEEIKAQEAPRQILMKAVEKWSLSMRSYYRLIRVARTIADLELSETIHRDHMVEALSYRFWQEG